MRLSTTFVVFSLSLLPCDRAPPSAAEMAKRVRIEADELHERAIRLQADRRWAKRAALLHVRSARLRPPSDPRAHECYAAAATVLLAADRIDRARAVWEEAGSIALARRDSLSAARAYVEAALIAVRARRADQVMALAERVRTIMRTAALPSADIAELARQVDRAVADANAATRLNSRHQAH